MLNQRNNYLNSLVGKRITAIDHHAANVIYIHFDDGAVGVIEAQVLFPGGSPTQMLDAREGHPATEQERPSVAMTYLLEQAGYDYQIYTLNKGQE